MRFVEFTTGRDDCAEQSFVDPAAVYLLRGRADENVTLAHLVGGEILVVQGNVQAIAAQLQGRPPAPAPRAPRQPMAPGLVGQIRAARAARGLSQAGLAGALGLSQAAIAKIESGETRRSKYLPTVVDFLGLPLELLRP